MNEEDKANEILALSSQAWRLRLRIKHIILSKVAHQMLTLKRTTLMMPDGTETSDIDEFSQAVTNHGSCKKNMETISECYAKILSLHKSV